MFETTGNRIRKAVDRMRLLAGQDSSGNGLPFRVDAAGRLEVVSYRTNHTCRVYDSSNQSVSHATWTALTFDSESFDDDGMHDLTTNTDRITIIHAGLYLIGGAVQFDAHATGHRALEVRLNGTTVISRGFAWGGATYKPYVKMADIYSLAADDYLQLRAYQSSGGPLNVLTDGVYSPLFWAARL